MSFPIKEARIAAGMSQKEVAVSLHVAAPTVSEWESGRKTPTIENLMKLAALFNVSADTLLGLPADEGIKVPVLGSVPAGIPLEAIENVVDWEEIPRQMAAGGKEFFALRVKGDSMYPEYLEGDTVIVQKTPICQSGDVCIVYANGYDATLKQVKLGEDGSITLVPRNPQYPPRTYSAEEIEKTPVSIAGVVVELRRKVRKL